MRDVSVILASPGSADPTNIYTLDNNLSAMPSQLDTNTSCINTTGQDTYSRVGLVAVGFEGVLMVLIIFGNGLIFAAFGRNERLRTLTNYYILQLAIADFSVGCLMPMHMAMYLQRSILDDLHTCLFRYTSMLLFQSASISALVALTFDRFTAITWPLRYHEKLTNKQYVRSVFVVWFFPIVLGLFLPHLWHNKCEDWPQKECDFMYVLKTEYIGFCMIPAFIVCTVILISLYVQIFSVASKHATEIAKREKLVGNMKSSRKEKKRLTRDMKMVKTGMIVLGGFYLCWLPFIIMSGIQAYGGLVEGKAMMHSRNMALFPAIFNSALNPIIYSFRMSHFKAEFGSILRLRRSRTSWDNGSDPEPEVVSLQNDIHRVNSSGTFV